MLCWWSKSTRDVCGGGLEGGRVLRLDRNVDPYRLCNLNCDDADGSIGGERTSIGKRSRANVDDDVVNVIV